MFNGLKTTEFWVTALVVGGAVVTELTSANVLPEKYLSLAAAIASGMYAISRGLKKANRGGI